MSSITVAPRRGAEIYKQEDVQLPEKRHFSLGTVVISAMYTHHMQKSKHQFKMEMFQLLKNEPLLIRWKLEFKM